MTELLSGWQSRVRSWAFPIWSSEWSHKACVEVTLKTSKAGAVIPGSAAPRLAGPHVRSIFRTGLSSEDCCS